MDRRWLDPDLTTDSELTAADAAAARLGSAVHAQLLAAGERSSTAASLDDELGVWRKLIEMVSGESAIVSRVESVALRAPLERTPEEGSVALPEQIELLPTRAQNRALYRFLAFQLAGRREFGTYALRRSRAGTPNATLVDRLRNTRERATPSALEEVFLLAEGVRVQQRIAIAYPGSVRDTAELADALLAHGRDQPRPTLAGIYDALLALACLPVAPAELPGWLPRAPADRVLSMLAPLRSERATVEDSLAIARRLFAFFATPAFQRGLTFKEVRATDDDRDASFESVNVSELASDGGTIELELPQADDSVEGASPPGSNPPGKRERAGEGAADDGTHLATDADGETDSDLEVIDTELDAIPVRRPRAAVSGQTFLYDEWDHTIGDYRRRYCRVHELALPSDLTGFFERTRLAYATVLSQVRHQFERIRPERYRPLRGLEDGEDFDLNALIEARIEARARRAPNTRVYTARTRQQRDVATLFLLDMSASTEQPFANPGDPPPHRIIDTLKEALVVMSSALDDLGDNYAIYGFSSHGRDRVEVFLVKAFGETLGQEVQARIGSIAPKNGTRMGAALRHVLTKFAATSARSKHLILLSDGFPQDQEYGPDRRSHAYGIQDTAVALRELQVKGVTPFCITVDRAGNDYLREMCAPAQYLVIEHLEDLPGELPKIYRRVVQS
jgi:hypothetical protein